MKKPLLILLSTLLTAAPCVAGAAATRYKMDVGKSSLKFVAEQIGAKFEGSFAKFDAKIAFSPEDLAGSSFDVTVDPASADTKEKKRNKTLRGPDFFDVEHFKSAHYVTSSFKKTGETSFEATGKLTLRDVTRDVPIAFTFTTRKEGSANVATLAGTATVKRLEFGIGRGEYEDVEGVGADVQIKFNLRLVPAPTPSAAQQKQ